MDPLTNEVFVKSSYAPDIPNSNADASLDMDEMEEEEEIEGEEGEEGDGGEEGETEEDEFTEDLVSGLGLIVILLILMSTQPFIPYSWFSLRGFNFCACAKTQKLSPVINDNMYLIENTHVSFHMWTN